MFGSPQILGPATPLRVMSTFCEVTRFIGDTWATFDTLLRFT